MAIQVSCQCGKQLRVKDEYAGRKGKCPACGGVIQIPAAEPDLFDLKDEPAVAPKKVAPPPPRPSPVSAPMAARSPQPRTSPQMMKAKPATPMPALAQPSRSSLREYVYFSLLLAFIPLVIS